MPLKYLLKWAPFKIDALAFVTLLGADEINRATGTLALNRIAEFLPLIGGHVIAGDSIRKPVSGFTLYNISDGICAPDVVPWLSRWLQSQHLTYNATTLTVGFVGPLSRKRRSPFWTVGLGIIVNIVLISFPIILRDLWGFANAIALVTAVVLRKVMIEALREAVDLSAARASYQNQELVKTILTLPDGSSVVVYTCRGLVTECLLSNPVPRHRKRYAAYKIASWMVFIIHIASIGMAALPTQLLTVIIVAASTICIIKGVATDHQTIGSTIQIRRFDVENGSQSMAAMFARLHLKPSEEACMVSWKLMPSRTNRVWWSKYRNSLSKGTPDAFDSWKEKVSWVETDSLLHGMGRRSSTESDQGAET